MQKQSILKKRFYRKINFLLSKKLAKQEQVNNEPAFCIKENYRHRLKPKYFQDSLTEKSGTTWQPDVYDFASKLATRFGCTHILDVGCGTANKLVSLYPKFEIIGIDFEQNLKKCSSKYPFGKWIESDLEKPLSINLDTVKLEKTAIICSDVIEHIINPTNLLNNLKILLNHSLFCILTTPERDLARGKDDLGPPGNPHHVREWNLQELENLLIDFGFKIACIGLTAGNDKDYKKHTILVCLKNNKDKDNSEKWLKLNREHTNILKYY